MWIVQLATRAIWSKSAIAGRRDADGGLAAVAPLAVREVGKSYFRWVSTIPTVLRTAYF